MGSGWGIAAEAGEFSRIFVLKVAVIYRKKLGEQGVLVFSPNNFLGSSWSPISSAYVCKVTFNCNLQKKLGEQDVLVCSPNNFLGGATAPPFAVPIYLT